MKKIISSLMALAVVVTAQSAAAHTGHAHAGEWASEFVAGLAHPLAGMDHLLAILAVGMWSALVGQGARRLAAPGAFMLALSLGAGVAVLGLGQITWLELAIALSVAALGAMLILGQRLAQPFGMALIALAGLAHGWAHGAEMLGQSFAVYAAGFLLSTAVMHGVGWLAGRQLLQMRHWVAQGTGLLLTLAGLGMSVAAAI